MKDAKQFITLYQLEEQYLEQLRIQHTKITTAGKVQRELKIEFTND